jgi:hypothetical protein
VAELKVDPPLLRDQGWQYSQQSRALAEALKQGMPLLEQLRKDGLGWDEAGRKFSLPYSKQEDKVGEVLANMAGVFAEITQALGILARRLPQADEDSAAQFKRLLKDMERMPDIQPRVIPKGTP